jgi:hypothetical protein
MPGLPATGTLSYNGYTFDGASHVECDIQPIYDDAGRTVTAHRHLITVSATVANDGITGGDLDRDLLNIRRRLTEAGRPLTFVNKGFGVDVRVGSTGAGGVQGSVSDTNNGPKPQLLSWEPVGDDKAAQIEWQVETTFPVCRGTVRYTGVAAINFGMSYDINEHGSTTRTITGYIEIAMKRGATRSTDTADNYRRVFTPEPIRGFKRTQNWTTSPDRKRLTFTITDTEIFSANPYPESITAIDATHQVSWRRGRSGLKFFNTISATITPEANLTGSQAWMVFLTLAIQRLSHARDNGQQPFIEALDVEESLFGRSHRFSVVYRFTSCIRDFIGDAGLWRPIGTDWTKWARSLSDTMFHNRGSARLTDLARDDVFVSLCGSAGAATVSPNNRRSQPRSRERSKGNFKNEKPRPEQSWLNYESSVIPYRNRPAVRQSILQPPDRDDGGYIMDSGTPSTVFNYGSSGATVPDVIQVGGAGRHGVRFIGRAKRAGHQIGRPRVLRVGNKPVVERSSRFLERAVGNFFGIPVYEAMWDLDYLISNSPGVVKPPDDESEWVNSKTNTTSLGTRGT